MISTFLAGVLTSALLLSTFASPSSTTQLLVVTQVLPVDNFVGYTPYAGDSLKSIALLYYGDKNYWTNIWNDNPWINNPEKLEEEKTLRIATGIPPKPGELINSLKEKYNTQQHAFQTIYNPPAQPIFSPASPETSFEEVYKQAGAKYGVPWQILYGIHMTETGGRNGPIASGYGTGAEGPMQFMPGTFSAYAVDGDGDGIADINNANDAIYTAANYLSQHGSLMAGLQSYGGNTSGTLAFARSKGFNQ